MKQAVIMLDGLTKSYGKHRGIENLTYSVLPGEIFGFIGPNGAGKTTTIRTLMGLLKPTSGNATIFGLDCTQHAAEIAKNVGYLPSENCYYNNLKVKEQLQYTADLYGVNCHDRIEELAERLNLDLSRKIGDLSLGNKKKVGIVSALLPSPKLLILDEPTAGLDPKGRDDILDQIAELHKVRGITIILVSHSMEDIAKYVERLIVMNRGEAVFDDNPKAVFAHYQELESMGLAAPQITYIMHALKEHGLQVDEDATTVEEARSSILSALSEMNSPLLQSEVTGGREDA